jgi:hypothetical protein
MTTVLVKAAPSYWFRMVPPLILGAVVGLVVVGRGLGDASGGGVFVACGVLLAVAPLVILVRSRLSWASRIDPTGVTLASGRLLPWSDFRSVRTVHVRGAVNHYEIVFRSGVARIFPRVTQNSAQVLAVVAALERGGPPALPR